MKGWAMLFLASFSGSTVATRQWRLRIGQRLAQLSRRFCADLLPVFRTLPALAAEQKGKAHG
jgi:hypothetical protein